MPSSTSPIAISGVVPRLSVTAAPPPRAVTTLGALSPWADRLWVVTCVAHKSPTGDGAGLFSFDDDLPVSKHPESVVGTYANRMVHQETSQLFIGPHVIDVAGNVRTIGALVDIRITGTA